MSFLRPSIGPKSAVATNLLPFGIDVLLADTGTAPAAPTGSHPCITGQFGSAEPDTAGTPHHPVGQNIDGEFAEANLLPAETAALEEPFENRAVDHRASTPRGTASRALRTDTTPSFCLGRIESRVDWDVDESKSTEELQAWQATFHKLGKDSFKRIKAHLKKSNDATTDEKGYNIIPFSYVECGGRTFNVASFRLFEVLGQIEIRWPPSPRGEVYQLEEPMSTGLSTSTRRGASNRTLSAVVRLEATAERQRAQQAAVPLDAPAGRQFSDPTNPFGRFIYWERVGQAEHLEEKMDELSSTVRRMQLEQLTREGALKRQEKMATVSLRRVRLDRNDQSLVRLRRDLMLGITGPEIPFIPEGSYRTYLNAPFQQRRAILWGQAKMITMGIPNDEYLQREHLAFLNKTEKNPILNENKWRYKIMDNEAAEKSQMFLGKKIVLARDGKQAFKQLESREVQEKIKAIDLPSLDLYLNQYIPPTNRILITSNITFNSLNRIPVFCDISKSLEELEIPENTSLTFNYIDSNIVNAKIEKKLANAVSMAQKSKNQIKCECHSKNLKCYENLKCPCFDMNKKMQMLQPGKDSNHSKFRSLNPIQFTNPFCVGYVTVGFACSDLCDCGGKCHNNSMMIPEMNLFPLEIYRMDGGMGFMIRSTVFIPAGTPVMEFVGEIRADENLPDEHKDYSLRQNYADDTNWRKRILNELKFEEEYKKCLRDLSYTVFNVDPTLHGNVGRMAAHSCCPNMEVVKVYRKSLSPAHASLIMVTIEDVYPGTPLSFDYESNYNEVVRTSCRCATFACRKNSDIEVFKTLDHINLSRAIKKLHELRHEAFKRDVLDPIEAKK